MQPTVSDHIKALEEELNCRLFDRLSRKIIPTKEAKILFIHASEIIERLIHLKDAVGRLRERKEMEKNLEGKGISLDGLNVAGYFSSTDAVKQAVKAGMGVSILSRFSVQEELKYGTLKEVKVAGLEMKRNFYLLTHRKRSLPLLYSVFPENLKISPAITAS